MSGGTNYNSSWPKGYKEAFRKWMRAFDQFKGTTDSILRRHVNTELHALHARVVEARKS